ncbi:DUF2946 domain-containing protein [uncultured Pluralibacter sp.]|uniref:DUF2946 domain-containing protein n=1 Tax=uncultured Pluralibacter sp. TaxID=1490864 RepID=UPI00261B8E4A|nr:DUF2946 domain-containing protein [uncultured Pluralibacter sp.]
MNALWLYRLRYIRRHLAMLLVMLCAILLQSQLAAAAHRCQINLLGESVGVQHAVHLNEKSAPKGMGKTLLCEKHCLPDSGQQSSDYPPLIALPATLSVAVIEPDPRAARPADYRLPPPAAGPPATIRFCRFRE